MLFPLFPVLLRLALLSLWTAGAVLALRWVLRRGPKGLRMLLWALLALRLLCPAEPASPFSLVRGIPGFPGAAAGAAFSGAGAGGAGAAAPEKSLLRAACGLWALGAAGMAVGSGVRALRLRRRLRTAAPAGDGVWEADCIAVPFVLGTVAPKIYLPSGLDRAQYPFVLAHERAHIARRDQWWKLLAFALLCVYWFTPHLWVCYHLFCGDMELACDERAVRDMDLKQRKAYALALVSLSTRTPAGALGFAAAGVDRRVHSVLQSRRWGPGKLLAALLLSCCAAVSVLTVPLPLAQRAAPASHGPGAAPVPTETARAHTAPSRPAPAPAREAPAAPEAGISAAGPEETAGGPAAPAPALAVPAAAAEADSVPAPSPGFPSAPAAAPGRSEAPASGVKQVPAPAAGSGRQPALEAPAERAQQSRPDDAESMVVVVELSNLTELWRQPS